jgi:AcrR family transcriptional regulator
MADNEPPPRRRSRGRPRDPNIEPVVLATTRQLLGESGFAATTVQEISRRCGVNVPAIYRRWPTRLALIEEAAFSALTQVTVEPTGDLRADLCRLIQMFEGGLGTPAARAAIPGLMAAYQHEAPPPTQWLQFSLRPHFFAIVKAAGIDPSLDLDEVFDVIHGIILGRIFVPVAAARHRPIDNVVEMISRILTPPANATSAGLPAR